MGQQQAPRLTSLGGVPNGIVVLPESVSACNPERPSSALRDALHHGMGLMFAAYGCLTWTGRVDHEFKLLRLRHRRSLSLSLLSGRSCH